MYQVRTLVIVQQSKYMAEEGGNSLEPAIKEAIAMFQITDRQ